MLLLYYYYCVCMYVLLCVCLVYHCVLYDALLLVCVVTRVSHIVTPLCARMRRVARALSTRILLLLRAHCSHVCSMKSIILIIFSHICSIATILDKLDTLAKSHCRKILL